MTCKNLEIKLFAELGFNLENKFFDVNSLQPTPCLDVQGVKET